jgi:hypothetical protein
MRARDLFQRHVALPGDHGAWVLLLGPLLIGLCAGGRWRTVSLYLTVAVLAAFMIRQPITLVVKAYSGRRSGDVLPAAWFWTAVYAAIGLLHVVGLVIRGYGYLLYLALPGLPVFVWHLWLVSRRAERRQWLVELLASGALALAAPAGMWVGLGRPDPTGWLLWCIVWAQSVTSIAHAYMRLAQRGLDRTPARPERLRMGAAPLVASLGALAVVLVLGLEGILPRWLFVPYALQAVEVIRGVSRPAIGLKPRAIGFRQLAVSTLFTVLFILTWRF